MLCRILLTKSTAYELIFSPLGLFFKPEAGSCNTKRFHFPYNRHTSWPNFIRIKSVGYYLKIVWNVHFSFCSDDGRLGTRWIGFWCVALLVLKTYSKVLVGRHLFDLFRAQNGLETRKWFIAIVFQFFCTVRHWEGKSEWLEIKWYTSVSSSWWWQ